MGFNTLIEVKADNDELFQELIDASSATVFGMDIDIDNLDGYYDWLTTYAECTFRDQENRKPNIYLIKGREYNKKYNLPEDDCFVDDLNIVLVPLTEFEDWRPLISHRFDVKGLEIEWFDEVVQADLDAMS